MSDIIERLSLSSDPEKRAAAIEIERLRGGSGPMLEGCAISRRRRARGDLGACGKRCAVLGSR